MSDKSLFHFHKLSETLHKFIGTNFHYQTVLKPLRESIKPPGGSCHPIFKEPSNAARTYLNIGFVDWLGCVTAKTNWYYSARASKTQRSARK